MQNFQKKNCLKCQNLRKLQRRDFFCERSHYGKGSKSKKLTKYFFLLLKFSKLFFITEVEFF